MRNILYNAFIAMLFVSLSCLVFGMSESSDEFLQSVDKIQFVSEMPTIDGVLDENLDKLTERTIPLIWKSNDQNPEVPASYRIAYGTCFLYLYVEVKEEEMCYRDRAYQNGDGFHFVIAKVEENNAPTEEFYVMASSAVNRPQMKWNERIFWYYNVTTIFKEVSDKAVMVANDGDGIISFELLLPWDDLHPYHPWLSEGIGFNLGFMKGYGDEEKNYYRLMADAPIDRENSPRAYLPMTFELPKSVEQQQAYVQLSRYTITFGESTRLKCEIVDSEDSMTDVITTCKNDDGESLFSVTNTTPTVKGLLSTEFDLHEVSNLTPGKYELTHFDREMNAIGKDELNILPKGGLSGLEQGFKEVRDKLSQGSVNSIGFHLDELKDKLSKLYWYETADAISAEMKCFHSIIESARNGADSIAEAHGPVRRAYRSQVDDTLQPYYVLVPEQYEKDKKYPLVVFLHGSASWEDNILGAAQAFPKDVFGLGPRGRGPSNLYIADHAQDDIRESIEDVIKHYPVDPDKIILSGFSMGGWGVYRTFWEQPELFAGLAIFSGHPALAKKWEVGDNEPSFLDPENLNIFKDIPMFIFHGTEDRNCPFEVTKELVGKLQKAGADVTHHFAEGVGHEPPGMEAVIKFQQWIKKVAGQ